MQKTNLELFKERIKQNYAEYKSEMIMLNAEEVYSMANWIAAVEDTYEQLMEYDWVDDDDAEYLLKFYNQLELIADCLLEMRNDQLVEIDEALYVIFDREDNEENYITVEYAEKLLKKHGADKSIRMAILMELIEAGEQYSQLLKMDKDREGSYCLYEE